MDIPRISIINNDLYLGGIVQPSVMLDHLSHQNISCIEFCDIDFTTLHRYFSKTALQNLCYNVYDTVLISDCRIPRNFQGFFTAQMILRRCDCYFDFGIFMMPPIFVLRECQIFSHIGEPKKINCELQNCEFKSHETEKLFVG
jgi:hypothetical protein